MGSRQFTVFLIVVAIVSFVTTLGCRYVSERLHAQKEWNTTALEPRFRELSVFTGDQFKVNFSFFVENSTDADYIFPTDTTSLYLSFPGNKGLYQVNKSAEADLDKSSPTDPYLVNATIDPAIIPAKQRVMVAIHLYYDYNDAFPKTEKDNVAKMGAFIKNRMKSVDGFTVFDKTSRYQINFSDDDSPNGWHHWPDSGATKKP